MSGTSSNKLADQTSYDIRYSTLVDGAPLKEWLLQEEMRQWYPPSSDLDVDSFVRNWIGFARYQSSLTATLNGEMVGITTIFLMPYLKVAHLCMLYIAVHPDHQNKGIGGSLIKNSKHLAKTRFRLESMHIELWEGSPLLHLLPRYDFKEIIRQENFVQMPDGFRARLVWETQL